MSSRPDNVAVTPTRIHRKDLVSLLAASLGMEKATTLVMDGSISLGLPTFDYSLADAHQLFEHLAKSDGLISITCSLAKTRLNRMFG